MWKPETLAVLSVAGLLLAARPVLAAESAGSDDTQAPSANADSEGKPASEATPGAKWAHHGHHGRHHHHQQATDEGTSSTPESGSGGAPHSQDAD
jgi:hypothetical protein